MNDNNLEPNEVLRMGCGGSHGMAGAASGGLGGLVAGSLNFAGSLASQILVVLTSGPVLGFLAGLVLLLAVAALLKVLLRSTATTRRSNGQ